MTETATLYPEPMQRDPREVLIAAVNGNPVTPAEAWALLHEYDRLCGIEWLARDFVWSCPSDPEHVTHARLIEAFPVVESKAGA